MDHVIVDLTLSAFCRRHFFLLSSWPLGSVITFSANSKRRVQFYKSRHVDEDLRSISLYMILFVEIMNNFRRERVYAMTLHVSHHDGRSSSHAE